MAMVMNTTSTIERASAVLSRKCEETKKNMDRLLREAGCEGCRRIEMMLPLIPGAKDDVVFVGLNGAGFYFLRGTVVEMPEPLAEILRSCGEC